MLFSADTEPQEGHEACLIDYEDPWIDSRNYHEITTAEKIPARDAALENCKDVPDDTVSTRTSSREARLKTTVSLVRSIHGHAIPLQRTVE